MKRTMDVLGTLAVAMLLLSGSAHADFDWGADCDAGDGEFRQEVQYRDSVLVGEIPANKRSVFIWLRSDKDVDIQLYDAATDHALVAWPNGDLNDAYEETTTYEGVTYRYSGFNGVNDNFGHEFVEILGDSNRPLLMKIYGYAAGAADVAHSWLAVPTCNEIGDGQFSQYIEEGRIVDIGDIPVGKVNIDIELRAADGRDVDIQLIDLVDGHKVIAWPDGDLNGPEARAVDYKGTTIKYSGYHGVQGDRGWETVEVIGETSTELRIKAFGYTAGNTAVAYAWGRGAGAQCGSLNLPVCHPGLTCKNGDDGNIAVDIPGTCHTEHWCESNDSAADDCQNLPHPPVHGQWACDIFTCQWAPTGDPDNSRDGSKWVPPAMRSLVQLGQPTSPWRPMRASD